MSVYYDNRPIRIRSMLPEDAGIIYDTYSSYGWNPSEETFRDYLTGQENRTVLVFIAEYEGKVAGLCTLVLHPQKGPWAGLDYPEITDLCVFFHMHKKGIGSLLLETAEAEAAKISDMVYLSVGVHSGYGPAQRLYVKRGYNFDGSGVWYRGKQLGQYEPCRNDDDLLLFMAKRLNCPGRTE
ncbi:MAG: GNAT family N-acetyltransferase [Clostridia bacterium]|nr:GNAT family N-acetyltransferase [Clostridia bacterium]